MGNTLNGVCSCFNSDNQSAKTTIIQSEQQNQSHQKESNQKQIETQDSLYSAKRSNDNQPQKFQKNTSNEDKQSPLTIDDFLIIKSLGSGAFSQVFLVEKKSKGQQIQYAMKVIKKKTINDEKLIEGTLLEKNLLLNNHHRFITHLKFSFQTESKIYLIMEYVNGGSLFNILRNVKRFSEEQTKLIIAEVILGIEFLHNQVKVKYRDLKPENLLVRHDGHIKITDFGLSKVFKNKFDTTNTFTGTPEYLAPEMITQKGHNKDVDLWAIGILIYELLVGIPPFRDPSQNLLSILKQIIHNQVMFPDHFPKNAKDLIKKLLQNEPQERLGSFDMNELKQHPFFEGINWEDLALKKIDGPLLPYVKKNLSQHSTGQRGRPIYETPQNEKMLHLQGITYDRDNKMEASYKKH